MNPAIQKDNIFIELINLEKKITGCLTTLSINTDFTRRVFTQSATVTIVWLITHLKNM